MGWSQYLDITNPPRLKTDFAVLYPLLSALDERASVAIHHSSYDTYCPKAPSRLTKKTSNEQNIKRQLQYLNDYGFHGGTQLLNNQAINQVVIDNNVPYPEPPESGVGSPVISWNWTTIFEYLEIEPIGDLLPYQQMNIQAYPTDRTLYASRYAQWAHDMIRTINLFVLLWIPTTPATYEAKQNFVWFASGDSAASARDNLGGDPSHAGLLDSYYREKLYARGGEYVAFMQVPPLGVTLASVPTRYDASLLGRVVAASTLGGGSDFVSVNGYQLNCVYNFSSLGVVEENSENVTIHADVLPQSPPPIMSALGGWKLVHISAAGRFDIEGGFEFIEGS